MLSKAINIIPEGNALSGLHDILGKYDWAYGNLGTVVSALGICLPYTLGTMTIDTNYVY